MPTYVYRCKKCGSEFQLVARATDPPLTGCYVPLQGGQHCSGEVYRVIQPVGITFKGPGFHVNDYAKK